MRGGQWRRPAHGDDVSLAAFHLRSGNALIAARGADGGEHRCHIGKSAGHGLAVVVNSIRGLYRDW